MSPWERDDLGWTRSDADGAVLARIRRIGKGFEVRIGVKRFVRASAEEARQAADLVLAHRPIPNPWVYPNKRAGAR